jgi:hypothetical protein
MVDSAEVARRTTELRLALGRSSTRRVIMLMAALQRLVEPYPKAMYPETWEVLNECTGRFTQVDFAAAIFAADDLGTYPR